MQIRAQQHRKAADYMQARGDRIGPRFELAEAERLEHEAELVLDPVMHCTGPVTVGNRRRDGDRRPLWRLPRPAA